ncbi:MAG: TonB-dependent receptor [Pseudomonadota bacterium]
MLKFALMATSCLCTGILLSSTPTQAQTVSAEQENRLAPVTVTAQKQEQSLSDVPISITAIDGVRLADTSIPRLEDAALLAPNTTIVLDPIADKINIRGIYSGDQAGLEQSVSTFVDGVYRGRGVQSRFAFLDLERVEVLRGPQGVLFGKNTIGGAFNLTTAKPTDTPEFSLGAEYTFEGVEQLDLNAVASGPLGDRARARVAVLSRSITEGYVDNAFYGTSGPDLDEIAARGILDIDLTPRTLLRTRIEYGEFDLDEQPFTNRQAGPLASFGVVPSFDTSLIGSTNPVLDIGSAGRMDGDTFEGAITLEHEMDVGTVTAIAAYSSYDFTRFLDVDFSPVDIGRFDEAEDFDQTSFEIRFASPEDRSLRYILGAYAQTSDLFVEGLGYFNVRADGPELANEALLNGTCQGAIAAGADPATVAECGFIGLITAFDGTPLQWTDFSRLTSLDQTDDLWAIYGQASYDVTDQWTATLGLRFTDQTKEAFQSALATDFGTRNRNDAIGDNALYAPFGAPSPFTGLAESIIHEFTPDDLSRDEDDLSVSADLQYRPNEDVMLFAKYATGFKAGGFNSFALGADPAEAEFEEETAESFEVGGRFTLLGGDADLNVTAFYTTFEDIQTAQFTGAASFIVQNAAEATSQGIEIDGRWAPTDTLLLSGAVGYLDFEYDSFPNAGCTVNQLIGFRQETGNPFATNQDCSAVGTNDLSGRPSEHSPEWSATLGVRHDWALFGDYQLTTYGDVIYRSDQFKQIDLDPLSLQEAYTKLNLTLIFGPQGGNWDLSLIGKNLTDEETFSFVNDTPLVDTAFQMIPDRPRTVAIRARWRN